MQINRAGPAERLDREVLSLLEGQPAEKASGARSISVYRLKARVAAINSLSGFADEAVRSLVAWVPCRAVWLMCVSTSLTALDQIVFLNLALVASTSLGHACRRRRA